MPNQISILPEIPVAFKRIHVDTTAPVDTKDIWYNPNERAYFSYSVKDNAWNIFSLPEIIPCDNTFHVLAAIHHPIRGGAAYRSYSINLSRMFPAGTRVVFLSDTSVATGSYYHFSFSINNLLINSFYHTTGRFTTKSLDVSGGVLSFYSYGDVGRVVEGGMLKVFHPTLRDKAKLREGATAIVGGNEFLNPALLFRRDYSMTTTGDNEVSKVDLGSVYDVKKFSLTLAVEVSYGVGCKIWRSTDGTTWTQIPATLPIGELTTVVVENVSMRYFRITLGGDGTNASFIRVFSVFAFV